MKPRSCQRERRAMMSWAGSLSSLGRTFALETPDAVLGLPVGHHLSVRLPGGEGISRPYTPTTGDETKGSFDLVVKVYPNGIVSQYLNSVEVGDSVEISGPQGEITYKEPGFLSKLWAGFTALLGRKNVDPAADAFDLEALSASDKEAVIAAAARESVTEEEAWHVVQSLRGLEEKEVVASVGAAGAAKLRRLSQVVGSSAIFDPLSSWLVLSMLACLVLTQGHHGRAQCLIFRFFMPAGLFFSFTSMVGSLRSAGHVEIRNTHQTKTSQAIITKVRIQLAMLVLMSAYNCVALYYIDETAFGVVDAAELDRVVVVFATLFAWYQFTVTSGAPGPADLGLAAVARAATSETCPEAFINGTTNQTALDSCELHVFESWWAAPLLILLWFITIVPLLDILFDFSELAPVLDARKSWRFAWYLGDENPSRRRNLANESIAQHLEAEFRVEQSSDTLGQLATLFASLSGAASAQERWRLRGGLSFTRAVYAAYWETVWNARGNAACWETGNQNREDRKREQGTLVQSAKDPISYARRISTKQGLWAVRHSEGSVSFSIGLSALRDNAKSAATGVLARKCTSNFFTSKVEANARTIGAGSLIPRAHHIEQRIIEGQFPQIPFKSAEGALRAKIVKMSSIETRYKESLREELPDAAVSEIVREPEFILGTANGIESDQRVAVTADEMRKFFFPGLLVDMTTEEAARMGVTRARTVAGRPMRIVPEASIRMHGEGSAVLNYILEEDAGQDGGMGHCIRVVTQYGLDQNHCVSNQTASYDVNPLEPIGAEHLGKRVLVDTPCPDVDFVAVRIPRPTAPNAKAKSRARAKVAAAPPDPTTSRFGPAGRFGITTHGSTT
ncbi:unnamed protein product [Prorocentrum cordatum]|uniref:FAD-binding FR-type domain-containing protein n=1 Tax=Prorocentrum cordatum TaxID=2364126 RepID=A0ABN9W8R9_9DINO|nr:unnamed protein product [Polarella glacialis]